MIQPSYAPPPTTSATEVSSLALPGASFESRGLRLDSLQATRSTIVLDDPGWHPELLARVFPHPSLAEAILHVNAHLTTIETPVAPSAFDDSFVRNAAWYSSPEGGEISSFFSDNSPVLFWNAAAAGGFYSESGGTMTASMLEISFDISAVDAGFGIDASLLGATSGFWGSAGAFGPDLDLEMEVWSQSGELLAMMRSTVFRSSSRDAATAARESSVSP